MHFLLRTNITCIKSHIYIYVDVYITWFRNDWKLRLGAVLNVDQEVFMFLELRIGFLGISLHVDCLWLDAFCEDLAKQHVQRALKLCHRNERFS